MGSASAVGICNCAPRITSATTAEMDRTISEVRMDFTFVSPVAPIQTRPRVQIGHFTCCDRFRPRTQGIPLRVKLRWLQTGRYCSRGQVKDSTLWITRVLLRSTLTGIG